MLKIFDRMLQLFKQPSSANFPWGHEVTRLSIPLSIALGRRTAFNGQVKALPEAEVNNFLADFMQGHVATMPTLSPPTFTGE